MSRFRLFATPAWLLTLACLLAVLHLTGQGALGLPSGEDGFSEWLQQTSPVIITLACLRAISFAIAAYLLGCATLAALANGMRSSVLSRVAYFVSIPPVRRMNRCVLELSLAGILAMPSVASASTTSDDVPVLRNLAPAPPPPPAPAPAPAPALPPTVAEEPTAANAETWTVRYGENLWVIAESALRERIGRTPTETEIIPFWTALVQENQSRLANPENPDVIFVGQEFTLPRR